MTTAYETLLVEHKGPVCYLTINRPKALNALNSLALRELSAFLQSLTNGDMPRALVLAGAGGKAFVAGADIQEMAAMGHAEALAFSRLGQEMTLLMNRLPCVTMACVEGYALGGGCELAMACDLIVAGNNAVFGQPEVDLGLVPGFGGTQRLVQRVGPAVAMAMLLAGKRLTALEAFQLGLVSVVAEDPRAELEKLLKGVLRAGPHAVRESKFLCHAALDMSLEAGLAKEAQIFADCFAQAEAKEGMGAFLEKRRPYFFAGN